MTKSPLSDWLALREPADFAARSVPLTRAVLETLPRDRAPRIVDLGTGSGSNVRYLRTYVARDFSPASWLLVDADQALLDEAQARQPGVETRHMNLGTLDATVFAGRDLVSASALLDLVSESWIDALADHCRAAGAAVLFALNYNGKSQCTPQEPEDDTVLRLFNQHQRQNDKGFGCAAGPDANAIAVRSFRARGYAVRSERTDWRLPPDTFRLQRPLIEGWADAAIEIAPDRAPMIRDWLARRLAHVDARRSHIVVGHEDIGAWLDHAR